MRRVLNVARPRDLGDGSQTPSPRYFGRRGIWRWRIGALALCVILAVLLLAVSVRPQGTTQATTSGHSLLTTCLNAASAVNPIAAENTCPGTSAWKSLSTSISQREIAGFATPQTVDQGQAVRLYVSTQAPQYTFSVYRMGWYHGLGGRLMYTSPTLQGIRQPQALFDPATRTVSCDNWTHPITIAIPKTWVSGVYVVKLMSPSDVASYALFVVRSDTSHAPILFTMGTMTYQAYNTFGGYSLYYGPHINRNKRSYVVSFDRPYATGGGLSNFPIASNSLLRWAERDGLNMSYSTDVDTDARGALLRNHRLVVFADHDEYWTTAMRQQVTAARDHGISLAFFQANNMYWHARLGSSALGQKQTVICYRYAAEDPLAASDPKETTVRWRDAPVSEPEDALLGEMYMSIPDANTHAPLTLSSGAVPFLKGTDLHAGSSLPGLIGGELDAQWHTPAEPQHALVLATSFAPCHNSYCPLTQTALSQAVLSTAPSGAHVFNAGTFYWSYGLDDDPESAYFPSHHYANPGFQRFTYNLLQYMAGASLR